MKIHKLNRLRGFVAGGIVAGGLLCATHTLAVTVNKLSDNSSAVITIPVTIINPKPTCGISVRSHYPLNSLNEGRKNHKQFPVVLSCPGNVKSALKASLLAGSDAKLLGDGYRVAVSIDEQPPSSVTGPFFWLQDNDGRPIKLTDSDADAFCIATTEQSRTCSITPVTDVHADSLRGEVGVVSVNFNVIYPA
ncbi:TPA: hypothetical protein SJ142_004485 [Yersinia enterocolitica]|nr:hypothetical protein [Yersinia enterocolitica]